jgi:hypothetical protein
MEISAGKISTFKGIEANRSPAAEAGPLGVNELEGVAMVYSNVSDERDVYLPGAFSAFNGKNILFGFDHRNVLGVAVLQEREHEVTFRARILGDKLLCSQIWRCWQAGFLRDLCLSSIPLQTSTGRAADGQPVTVIHKAQPRELSAVLGPGILGCKITALGRLLEQETTWDKNALKGNFLDQAQLHLAFTWASWCQQHVNRNENRTEESYDEWFASIQI